MIMSTPQIIKFSGLLTETWAKSRGDTEKSDNECVLMFEYGYDVARVTKVLRMRMFLFYPDRRKPWL